MAIKSNFGLAAEIQVNRATLRHISGFVDEKKCFVMMRHYRLDWNAADTSKAENHLTWQKNLSCDCVDMHHDGFVQIAK